MIIFKPSACSSIPAKFAKRMEQYATSAPGMPNSRSTSLYGPRYEEGLPNQSPPPSLSPSPNRLKPSLPVVPLSPRHLRSEPFPVELKFTITRAMTKISAMPTISEIRFSKAISIWSPFRNMLIGLLDRASAYQLFMTLDYGFRPLQRSLLARAGARSVFQAHQAPVQRHSINS